MVVVYFCVCVLFLSKFVTKYLSSYNLHFVAGNSINYPSIFETISRIYFWNFFEKYRQFCVNLTSTCDFTSTYILRNIFDILKEKFIFIDLLKCNLFHVRSSIFQ
jgi:hypothetical protein